MMKRKWINIIAAVLLISTITGCGKKDVIKDEPVQEMVYDLTDFEISGDGIENQSYWKAMAHCYAAADNGYYYAAEEKGTLILLYYDKDSKQWIHLCNKPECEHNGSDCNAYYSGYIMSSVWRYKEYIYTIALNNGQGILVRSNLDGSGRQELFEIGSADSTANIFRLAFSDDCVYITTAYGNSGMENIKEVSVRKRSLDGKQDVNIYTSTDKDVVIESVKCYGSQVFFVVENITMDEETYRNKTTSKGLYCYDSKKNVVGKVFDEAVCDYAIDYEKKEIYYYVIEEGLYKYSFENQSKEELYEADMTMGLCQVSIDDKYIYLNNERWSAFMRAPEIEPKLVVLNQSGKQINVIPTDTYITFFGDKDNLLFNIKKSKDNTIPGYKSIGLINKNDIETAETWEEIK